MFTDTTTEAIKFNENPEQYLQQYLAKIKREKLGYRDIEAREAALPYAKFICSGCGKLYIEDQMIIQQGMCDCNSQIIANAACQSFEDPKSEAEYECLKCGQSDRFKNIENNGNKCTACSASHFIKTSLLEKVMENTRDYSMSTNKPLVDVWKEPGGKVYAHYQYELEGETEGDRSVNFVVCASGKFTDNDFLYFSYNDGDPIAKVYTDTSSDPYPQTNLKCATAWAFDADQSSNNFEYVDAKNNIVQQGDLVEYPVKEGFVRGIVADIKYDGVKVSLEKHPEYGHDLQGKYSMVLSQNDFLNHNIIVR